MNYQRPSLLTGRHQLASNQTNSLNGHHDTWCFNRNQAALRYLPRALFTRAGATTGARGAAVPVRVGGVDGASLHSLHANSQAGGVARQRPPSGESAATQIGAVSLFFCFDFFFSYFLDLCAVSQAPLLLVVRVGCAGTGRRDATNSRTALVRRRAALNLCRIDGADLGGESIASACVPSYGVVRAMVIQTPSDQQMTPSRIASGSLSNGGFALCSNVDLGSCTLMAC